MPNLSSNLHKGNNPIMNSEINMHNLIDLQIDPAFPWLSDWQGMFQDLITLCAAYDKEVPFHFRVIYQAAFSTENMRSMGDGFYIQSGKVLDTKYGVQLETEDDHSLILKASKPALEWFIWGTQLALLRTGAVLVHCAAVEKDGKAILFPSWGGVGKTALVAEFVRSLGYKLLGDDLAIVSADGQCFGLPKAMVLYPYHRPLFPEVFDSGRGPSAPVFLNEALTKAAIRVKPLLRLSSPLLQFARRHNPQSVRIDPSQVFGLAGLSKQAQVEAVVWLDRRTEIETPQYQAADELLASRILGSTLNEIDPRCVKLTNIAMGVGVIDASDLFKPWLDILQGVTHQTRNALLYLPTDMPTSEVPTVVEQILKQQEII